MKILIVEDEMIIALDVAEMLEEMKHEVVGIVDHFDKIKTSVELYEPHLVLCDIRIKGEKDGIHVARLLREEYSLPVIFLTSHSDKAIVTRAIDINPLGYLIKPVREEELFVAIEVAQKQIESLKETKYVHIKIGYESIRLAINTISHLESDGNYTKFFAENNSYVSSKNLKKWLDEEDFLGFIRIHRSIAVNPMSISKVTAKSVVIGTLELPVGRSYRSNLDAVITS